MLGGVGRPAVVWLGRDCPHCRSRFPRFGSPLSDQVRGEEHASRVVEVSARGPGLWQGESGADLTVVAELVSSASDRPRAATRAAVARR